MGNAIEFEPTEEQFGIFWKYLEDKNVTGINYNGKQLWITDLKRGRYQAKEEFAGNFLAQFMNTFWKYLEDKNVTGINYNGKQLWITDLKRGRYQAKEEFAGNFLAQFMNTIANCVNKQFNNAYPVLEADTKELRISILHDRVAKSGISISIRKSPPMIRNTIDQLIKRLAFRFVSRRQ